MGRTDLAADVAVLGVRHHGPGSARSVALALDQFAPDHVLIEGPPELDGLVACAPRLTPPVAALVYAPAEPTTASFYPFASFSPEWVALRWAHDHGVPVSFADLPATNMLVLRGDPSVASSGHGDPLATLAAAAGYADPERWWEDAVESRRRGLDAFALVREAMDGVRAADDVDEMTLLREAAMRRIMRGVVKRGVDRLAFVCGAYHAPAVQADRFPSQAADAATVRGLKKVKVAATWVPWTTPRLATASGYGAGVASPGWYDHLFSSDGDTVASWLVKTARELRRRQLATSPASVVEATRLADTLAVVRGRPEPGLDEVLDASLTVLCEGSATRLETVTRSLLVGAAVGDVPDDVPKVPIAHDLDRLTRRLRLPRRADVDIVELDLRKPRHLERSILFHRLSLLAIDWAEEIDAGGTTGSFKERWALEWRPELSVRLVDASARGGTVEDAAAATAIDRAETDDRLDRLARLLDATVPADLPVATRTVLRAIADGAARQHDTLQLMAAVEPLGRVQRYGDVRGVDRELLGEVVRGVLTRISIGLAPACAGVDDDVAVEILDHLDATARVVALLDDPARTDEWLDAAAALARRGDVPGVLVGRAVRLLLDGHRLDASEAARRLSLVLSSAAPASFGAGWVEGFLAGDAVLLLHDHDLLAVLDDWIATVDAAVFDDLLPLLRRTFSTFPSPDRRAIGERLVTLDGGDPSITSIADDAAVAAVLPRILELMGRTP